MTAIAAVGWLLDRIGVPTALGIAADHLGAAAPYVAGALWIAAAAILIRARGCLPGNDRRDGRRHGQANDRNRLA